MPEDQKTPGTIEEVVTNQPNPESSDQGITILDQLPGAVQKIVAGDVEKAAFVLPEAISELRAYYSLLSMSDEELATGGFTNESYTIFEKIIIEATHPGAVDLAILPYLQTFFEKVKTGSWESTVWCLGSCVAEIMLEYPDSLEAKKLGMLLYDYVITKFKVILNNADMESDVFLVVATDYLKCLTGILGSGITDRRIVKIGNKLIALYGEKSFLDQTGFDIEVADFMALTKNRKAIPLLKRMIFSNDSPEIVRALLTLGVSEEEIYAPQKKEADYESSLCWPEALAVVDLLKSGRTIKGELFSGAKLLDRVAKSQDWVTINEPGLAGEVCFELKINPSLLSAVDNVLGSSIGKKIAKLTPEDYKIYADEILDAVCQVSAGRADITPHLAGLLGNVRYGGDLKLRYVKRELADLSLGDKCGDCTSKGSVNYENSVLWLANPAYQIIKMSKHGRFLGKMNIALGTVNSRDIIFIDALEFNPQALSGKPYHSDAKECFEEALRFVKELAGKMGRDLYALVRSNSSEANNILGRMANATKIKNIMLRAIVPDQDIKRVLKSAGFEGQYKLFYQAFDHVLNTADGADLNSDSLQDKKLIRIESEIINPAQKEDARVAELMRSRDFASASALILANERWLEKLRVIYNLPANMKISPEFLAKKMELLFKGDAQTNESLSKGFLLSGDVFVLLQQL